jgi:hypothetical protein
MFNEIQGKIFVYFMRCIWGLISSVTTVFWLQSTVDEIILSIFWDHLSGLVYNQTYAVDTGFRQHLAPACWGSLTCGTCMQTVTTGVGKNTDVMDIGYLTTVVFSNGNFVAASSWRCFKSRRRIIVLYKEMPVISLWKSVFVVMWVWSVFCLQYRYMRKQLPTSFY